MAKFVVAGIIDCINFAHIDYVTQHLEEVLPDFQRKRIVIQRLDWDKWINDLNRENNWNYHHSPIIWKEPGLSGGKKHLVGGASEFWEHCYEYYGLLSDLSKQHKEQLSLDILQSFLNEEEINREKRKYYECRRITISGAGSPMTPLLVGELLRTPELRLKDGAYIQLCDRNGMKKEMKCLMDDVKGLGVMTGLGAVRLVETLEEGLYNCDLLIILDQAPREEDEELEPWLLRNKLLMQDIGEEINNYAPIGCRIVYAAPGTVPTCFNTTVLADTAHKHNPRNIVAVTADLGYEAKHTMSKLSKIPVARIGCPPVWGFVGLNKYVDLYHCYMIHRYFEPNVRAAKAVKDTTLSTGEYKYNQLLIGALLNSIDDLWSQVKTAKDEMEACLGGPSFFAKVKATTDLLINWYSLSPRKVVQPLGILSNGSFGIPRGMYFSQTACVQNNTWVPMKRCLLPSNTGLKLKELFPLAIIYLKKFQIGRHLNAQWAMTAEEWNEYQQRRLEERMAREQEQEEILENLRKKEREIEEKREADRIAVYKLMAEETETMMMEIVIELTIADIINTALDICAPFPPRPEPVIIPQLKIEETGEQEVEEEEEEEEEEDD